MSDILSLSDDKIFYTIEGEGEYIGRPSVFMRLSMCNLTCKGFASKDSPHGCDSYISWSIKNRMTFEEIAQELSKYETNFAKGAIWKITGGEPLLQQAKLLRFCDYLAKQDNQSCLQRIDFETNATIVPDKKWRDEWKATFTTSPKLESNGDPERIRFNEHALEYHTAIGSGFKFVVQSEKDLDEIDQKYVKRFQIPSQRVWLMPAAGSRHEHMDKIEQVAGWAKKLNYNLSPRLHLVIWDQALKV